jgi:hypothetical protein
MTEYTRCRYRFQWCYPSPRRLPFALPFACSWTADVGYGAHRRARPHGDSR